MNEVDRLTDIANLHDALYSAFIKESVLIREDLRIMLNGKWITFQAEIQKYPKNIWGITKGQVKQIYIERRKIKIECQTWSIEGIKLPYIITTYPNRIKTISETEPL